MRGNYHIYPPIESPCGYWDDGRLRKVFGLSTVRIQDLLALENGASIQTYDQIRPAIFSAARDGYRSDTYMAFATACTNCSNPCFSLRINLNKFSLSQSNKRVLKGAASLKFRKHTPYEIIENPDLRKEMFNLFKKYQHARHSETGTMKKWDYRRFTEWIKQHNRIGTVRDKNDTLLGFSMCETYENDWRFGYCVFDPDHKGLSLGKAQWLRVVLEAYNEGREHVYVGDWSKGSPKLDYKTNYSGLEIYTYGEWVDFQPTTTYEPVDFMEKIETTFVGFGLHLEK
jgi:arginine-tRNA-protein transferase